MRYMTRTSLLATGLAFALTGAALAQGTASTSPAQGSRPAAQAPAAASTPAPAAAQRADACPGWQR